MYNQIKPIGTSSGASENVIQTLFEFYYGNTHCLYEIFTWKGSGVSSVKVKDFYASVVKDKKGISCILIVVKVLDQNEKNAVLASYCDYKLAKELDIPDAEEKSIYMIYGDEIVNTLIKVR